MKQHDLKNYEIIEIWVPPLSRSNNVVDGTIKRLARLVVCFRFGNRQWPSLLTFEALHLAGRFWGDEFVFDENSVIIITRTLFDLGVERDSTKLGKLVRTAAKKVTEAVRESGILKEGEK